MSFFARQQSQDIPTGNTGYVSNFHDVQVAEPVKLVGSNFTGNTLDTNFWTSTNTGTGSQTQATGTLTIATGVTANSTAQYQSVRTGRFIAKSENIFRTVMKVGDTGTANNIRNWGMFDANNGAFFQLSGTTLNIVTRSGGSDTAVAKSSWNINNTFTLDTNFHQYEIHVGYTACHFYVDDVYVHSVSTVGSATLCSQTFTLPVTLQNNNSGGSTSNVNAVFAFASIYRLGRIETEEIYKNIVGAATTTLKFGAGRLHSIVSNNAGTTATIFDNTTNSGTIIGTINFGATPVSLDYGCPFFTGLTIVTVGAGVNITVIYE